MKVEKRWIAHRSDICRSQVLFEKHGYDNCKFIVLEVCPLEERLEKEQWWLDHSVGAVNERSAIFDVENKKAWEKKYYEANKEKKKEASKAWIETNREKCLQTKKLYREANKERIKESKKAFYEANKEKIKEASKRYYESKAR